MSRKNSLEEKWDFHTSLYHFSTGISVSLHADTACCGVKKKKQRSFIDETEQVWHLLVWYESFSSCFTKVPFWVGVARPTAQQQLWDWLNSPQPLAAWVSGAELCLVLDLCWCLELIICLLLRCPVWKQGKQYCRNSGGDRKTACTTVWWQGAAKCNLEHKEEDMAGSLINCMNHDSGNEQAVSQEPIFSFTLLLCIWNPYRCQSGLSILSIVSDNKRINRGMHSNITALTASSLGKEEEVLQYVWMEKSCFSFCGVLRPKSQNICFMIVLFLKVSP